MFSCNKNSITTGDKYRSPKLAPTVNSIDPSEKPYIIIFFSLSFNPDFEKL